MYVEVPSGWKLGYDESTNLLKNVLNQLGLCNGKTSKDIDEYMFNNKITKKTKQQILESIRKQLLLSLNENKMENYRKLYRSMTIDELANPDLFVQYYCENYYVLNGFIKFTCLEEIYFSCCISKTKKKSKKKN